MGSIINRVKQVATYYNTSVVIADCLGHKSAHRMTNIYIRKDAKFVDEANRKVIDYVLYNKR